MYTFWFTNIFHNSVRQIGVAGCSSKEKMKDMEFQCNPLRHTCLHNLPWKFHFSIESHSQVMFSIVGEINDFVFKKGRGDCRSRSVLLCTKVWAAEYVGEFKNVIVTIQVHADWNKIHVYKFMVILPTGWGRQPNMRSEKTESTKTLKIC